LLPYQHSIVHALSLARNIAHWVAMAKGQWRTRSEINWPERNRLPAALHAATKNIEMEPDLRSFYGTFCVNGVNPYHWLRAVLEHIKYGAGKIPHVAAALHRPQR